MAAFRHVHLAHPIDFKVDFLVFNQSVSYFVAKFPSGWSAPNLVQPPSMDHAPWEEGKTEADLVKVAEHALKNVRDDGHVLVIHAPGKLAMVSSDKPVPVVDAVAVAQFGPALRAVPSQSVTDGPAPSWWP